MNQANEVPSPAEMFAKSSNGCQAELLGGVWVDPK